MDKYILIFSKQTEKMVKEYCKDYIQFINPNFNMPKFLIKFKMATRDVFANVRQLEDAYIVTVDPFLCKMPFAKETLYHEFTHIYDDTVMAKLGIAPSYMYHVYTEYHASQIQMMQKLGITCVYGELGSNTNHAIICDELLNEKADFAQRAQKLNLSKTCDFSKAIDWFCYYIGKTNTFLYYYNKYNDTLLDLYEFTNIFGSQIVQLKEALFECNTNNITETEIYNIAKKHLLLVKEFNPK